jgi:hypothetical protein
VAQRVKDTVAAVPGPATVIRSDGKKMIQTAYALSRTFGPDARETAGMGFVLVLIVLVILLAVLLVLRRSQSGPKTSPRR